MAGGASQAERKAPTAMATSATFAPSRRWTRSRSTKARPIVSTPDGAMTPGATGTRHGPCGGGQTVPTWPISQLAAGMVSVNSARQTSPSVSRRRSRSPVIRPFFSPLRPPAPPSLGAQRAGRAFAAAVAPSVSVDAVAPIARVRALDDEIDEGLAAQFVRQRESGGLVAPHQGRVQDEARLETEIERHLHGLDGVVAAVRIARVVGLTDAEHDMAAAAPIGEGGGERQKNEVAARHEGRGQAGVRHGDFGLAGQRRIRNGAERLKGEDVVFAEASVPERTRAGKRGPDGGAAIEFDPMALSVIEPKRFDRREPLQRPGETHRRVLSAGEQDESAIVIQASHGGSHHYA